MIMDGKLENALCKLTHWLSYPKSRDAIASKRWVHWLDVHQQKMILDNVLVMMYCKQYRLYLHITSLWWWEPCQYGTAQGHPVNSPDEDQWASSISFIDQSEAGFLWLWHPWSWAQDPECEIKYGVASLSDSGEWTNLRAKRWYFL